MNTVKIEIYIEQREAIRQGKNVYGSQIIDVDPVALTAEQRETLAKCETVYYGGENILKPQYGGRYNLPPIGEATLETAKILLDALAAEKIRVARDNEIKREQQICHAAALPLKDFIDNRNPNDLSCRWHLATYVPIGGELDKISNDPRIAARIVEAKQEIVRLNAELDIKEAEWKERRAEEERQKAEEKAAEERATAEKQARLKQQIAAWVAEKGTDNQKKRAALNLLPQEEIVNAIRDEAYAPLDGFARYEKIQKSDITCDCDEYSEPVFKYRAGDETEATAEDFDRMEQIQTALPGATLTLRWHRGYCETCSDPDDDNDGVFERHSIKAALTVGDFEFSREYAV